MAVGVAVGLFLLERVGAHVHVGRATFVFILDITLWTYFSFVDQFKLVLCAIIDGVRVCAVRWPVLHCCGARETAMLS